MTRAQHEALLSNTFEGLMRYFGAHELHRVEDATVPLVDPATGEAFEDRAFAWVSLRDRIEHAPDPAALVAEAWRVAREGVVLAAPWFDVTDPSQRRMAAALGAQAPATKLFDADLLRALLPEEPEAVQIHHNGFRTRLTDAERRDLLGPDGSEEELTWPEEVVLLAMKNPRAPARDESPKTAREVTVKEITREDLADLFRLAVRPAQRRFVAGVVPSMAQALVSDDAWCAVVRADGEAAGFVMFSTKVDENDRGPWLWRFLVDHRFQGLGVGARALKLAVDLAREQAPGWLGEPRWSTGPRELWSGVVEGPGSPLEFYRAQGFEVLDQYEEGERLIRHPL